MNLLGINGPKRSGKDTVAKFLVQRYGFTQLKFAEPIHQFIQTLKLDKNFEKEAYRNLMVMMGLTCRKLDTDIFVKYINDKIYEADLTNENIVISDIRFLNEWNWIKENGGVIWKISGRVNIDRNDPAEIGIPEYCVPDFILNNTGSMAYLQKQIIETLAKTKAIWGYKYD